MYLGFIVGGCVATEFVYGNVTDSIWNSRNKGKTYDTIDWSKFAGALTLSRPELG